MAWAPTAGDIDWSDVVQVKWRGHNIKKVLNGTVYIWPAPWEDTWSDVF